MRQLLSVLVCTTLLGIAPKHSQAEMVFGGFDFSRGGFGSLAESPELELELLRGVIRIVIDDEVFTSSPTLTPAYLDTVDVLVLSSIYAGYSPTQVVTPLSADEQAALFNYVLGGGHVLLAVEDDLFDVNADLTHESFLDPFGISATGQIQGSPYTLYSTGRATDLTHPIFHGPLGDFFDPFEMHAAGWLDHLGPYARPIAESDVNHFPVLAVIDRNAIAPGSGKVVIGTDTHLWMSDINMVGNLALYFATPEPTGISIAAFGGALLLGEALRRRRANRVSISHSAE
jgi:hypothetical protein